MDAHRNRLSEPEGTKKPARSGKSNVTQRPKEKTLQTPTDRQEEVKHLQRGPSRRVKEYNKKAEEEKTTTRKRGGERGENVENIDRGNTADRKIGVDETWGMKTRGLCQRGD